MYRDALDFLEEERDAWAPYEALAGLSDAQLEAPTDPTGPGHGWSARDLMGHLVAWQERLLAMAMELAVNDASPTRERVEAAWAADPDGVNAASLTEWRALPIGEVRRRFTTVPGELRGYLTVVPETRWLKNPQRLATFLGDSTEHYQEHTVELAAILALAAAG
ncbi:MAG TPA: maleylpyruvate isomerase N-terminal domain-containing protein [Candidatus Baltobacteraceae bacterium]|nr:maleylpyruvate isomerase N-terminal domain-containing protein [Candidatus Baltobacteraceae bacterium]